MIDNLIESPARRADRMRKETFAKRLYEMMVAKGWSQSDLARHAKLGTNGRQAVNSYLKHRSLPSPETLRALATAFGVEPETLMPEYAAEEAQITGVADFEVRTLAQMPDVAWLSVHRYVGTNLAFKIGQMLSEDDAPRRVQVAREQTRMENAARFDPAKAKRKK